MQKTNPTQEPSSLGRKWFYSTAFYIEDWIVWLYRYLSKRDVYTYVGNGCDAWRVLDMNVNHRAVQADYLFFQTTHKTDLYIYTHSHPHIHTLIHTHTHSPTQKHTHACASTQTPPPLNVDLSIVLAARKCDATWEQKMYIYMYTYTHTHIHTHTYTHVGQEMHFVTWCRETQKLSTLD